MGQPETNERCDESSSLKTALSLLSEAKEVLLQIDHRNNGKCYNPVEINCNCTTCKISNFLTNQNFQNAASHNTLHE